MRSLMRAAEGCWKRAAVRNAATAAVIGVMGDALMQHREGRSVPAELDLGRTCRLVSYRTVHAPIVDSCWRFFDRRIPLTGVAGVLARVAADQGLLMPPSLATFFLSQAALEGLPAEECVARARDSFIPAACICLPFWCTIHLLTFGVVRPKWRMAWASMCAVAWNALLSDQNQAAKRREQGEG